MRTASSSAAATSFQTLTASSPIEPSVRRKRVVPFIQIRVFRFQAVPNLVSIRRNIVFPVASSPSPESQVELGIANEDDETLAQLPDQGKDESGLGTVHVRLHLRRECHFGEQFLVAGDHPMLGLWSPSEAALMVWSDGHVWTAELDLPAGELIQFKFVLRRISGEMLWQPGPNRVIQTTETSNIILVFGDWEKVAVRQVLEERKGLRNDADGSDGEIQISHVESYNGDIVASLDGQEMAQSVEISSINEVVAQRLSSYALERSEVIVEMEQEIPVLVPGLRNDADGSDGEIQISHVESYNGDIVASLDGQETAQSVEISSINEVVAQRLSSYALERSQVIVEMEQEIPVLVPGLNPCLITPTEDVTVMEDEVKLDAFDNSSAEDCEPELDPKQVEVEGYRENEKEEEEASTESMFDKVDAPIQIDPKQEEEEVEGYREEEEEEAAIGELMFDKEHPSKQGFVSGDEPAQELQLTIYVGQGRNNNILHNYIRQGQETLRRFLNKLGFQ